MLVGLKAFNRFLHLYNILRTQLKVMAIDLRRFTYPAVKVLSNHGETRALYSDKSDTELITSEVVLEECQKLAPLYILPYNLQYDSLMSMQINLTSSRGGHVRKFTK